MAPPQASPYPLWPLSLVWHQLVQLVQYTIYTWTWDTTAFLVNLTKHPPQEMEFMPMPLWHTAQMSLPNLWSSWSPGPGHLHTGFPRDILYEITWWGLPGLRWNSRGVQAKAWRTLNTSLRLQPKHTLLLAFSYKLCMSSTSHSSMPSLRRAHQMTCQGTWWNAFPRWTKAMFSVLLNEYIKDGNYCFPITILV